MEPFEIVILIVGAAIAAQALIDKLPPASDFLAGFMDIFLSSLAILIYTIILIAIFLYYNKKWHYRQFQKKLEKENKETEMKSKRKDIETLIERSPEYNSDAYGKYLKELETVLNSVWCSELSDLSGDIRKRIEEVKRECEEVHHWEKVSSLQNSKRELEDKIHHLKWEAQERERKLREKEESSLEDLETEKHPVYVDMDLNENDRTLLKKHGYHRTCEYCVDRKRLLNVLVKPAMRHSVTHTFLVWSVLRLLDRLKGVTDIQTRDTREADIRFKFRSLRFAIEIETGSLLSKKHQLRAKAVDLISKYGDRWIILVSKKSLLPKYRIYGKVCSRSDVEKVLKKLLKSASPSKGDVSVDSRRGCG